VTKYEEFYRGVLIRKPNLVGEFANLSPSLGVAMHIDPEMKEKPVMELTRLSMGMDTSIYMTFQRDVGLAIWDPKERDSFFEQADRGGLKHFFRNSRLEHKANVLAAVNVLSGHVMENMHQAIAGKVEPGSKEMDADFAKEMLEMSYNEVTQQAASLLDASYTGNLSPTAFGYAVDRAMRAIDDHLLHKSSTELFQSIMLSNQKLCSALMDSAKDGSSYVRNLVNQSSEWASRERYFRDGFRDFNILTAERHSSAYGNATEPERASDDFSGHFEVKTDLWTPRGEIERHFNVIGAAGHGFDVGPSNFRRYANIQESIEKGVSWKEADSELKDSKPGSPDDRRHPILKGTPPDLPLLLAQDRLNLIEGRPGAEQSVVELKEILDAEENSRELNYSVFRSTSIGMKTAESTVENHTVEQLENQLKQKQISDTAEHISVFDLIEADESQYWLKRHPDYEGPDRTSPWPDLDSPS
jgi:hypothetical protein